MEQRERFADAGKPIEKVVDMGAHRPHLVIPTLDGNVHVLPVAMIEDWIKGKKRIQDSGDWEIVVRSIISEWKAQNGY